jgi:hypothetical protein
MGRPAARKCAACHDLAFLMFTWIRGSLLGASMRVTVRPPDAFRCKVLQVTP